MKALFSLGIVCLLFSNQAKEQNPWSQTKNWTLYKIKGHGIFDYPPDTLKNFKSIRLADDSVKFYLNSAHELDREPIAWMGGYVVSYEEGGELRKAEVGNYGGFIYDDKSRKTYEIPEELLAGWLAYFRRAFRLFE